jgi:hypothetical protein
MGFLYFLYKGSEHRGSTPRTPSSLSFNHNSGIFHFSFLTKKTKPSPLHSD